MDAGRMPAFPGEKNRRDASTTLKMDAGRMPAFPGEKNRRDACATLKMDAGRMPAFPGNEEQAGRLCHIKDGCQRADKISSAIKNNKFSFFYLQ
jgi:hypothetical protein